MDYDFRAVRVSGFEEESIEEETCISLSDYLAQVSVDMKLAIKTI